MNRSIIEMQKTNYLFFAVFVIISITYGCKKGEADKDLTIKGKLISNSECKNLKSAHVTTNTPDTISSVAYTFLKPGNKLLLTHINAGFNCCPGTLTCEFKLVGDTLIIQEFEEVAQCHCDCLYDLEIEIDGVETKKYQVKFIEPYAANLTPLIFELDLRTITSGSYGVVRKQYPWGISNNNEFKTLKTD